MQQRTRRGVAASARGGARAARLAGCRPGCGPGLTACSRPARLRARPRLPPCSATRPLSPESRCQSRSTLETSASRVGGPRVVAVQAPAARRGPAPAPAAGCSCGLGGDATRTYRPPPATPCAPLLTLRPPAPHPPTHPRRLHHQAGRAPLRGVRHRHGHVLWPRRRAAGLRQPGASGEALGGLGSWGLPGLVGRAGRSGRADGGAVAFAAPPAARAGAVPPCACSRRLLRETQRRAICLAPLPRLAWPHHWPGPMPACLPA